MKQTSNPWNYKPWWCQPWTIVLTGMLLIAFSWLLFSKIWLTVIVAIPILVWWFYFLLVWPKLVMESDVLDRQNQFLKESLTKPGK